MADRPHRALIIHCDGFLMDGPAASQAAENEEHSFTRTTIDAATCPHLDAFASQGCNGLVALREIPGLQDNPGPRSEETRSLLELAQFLGAYPAANPKEAAKRGPLLFLSLPLGVARQASGPRTPPSLADRFMKMQGKFLSASPQALALAHALGFSTSSLSRAIEADAADILAANEVPSWPSSTAQLAAEEAKARALAAGRSAAEAMARAAAAAASAESAAAVATEARRRAEAAQHEAEGTNPVVAASAARDAADAGTQAGAASITAAAAEREATGASAQALQAAHAALGASAEAEVLSLAGGGLAGATTHRNPGQCTDRPSEELRGQGEPQVDAGAMTLDPAVFDTPPGPLAAKLLKLQGLDKPLERGPPPTTAAALEGEVDLVWLHLHLGVGHVAADDWSRAVQALQWVDALVGELMKLSAPGAGTKAEQHLYAVLIVGYGARDVARGESPGALVLPRGKQEGRPLQSYETKDGAPVPLLRYHHPALLCRNLTAVTRRDEASKLGVAECMQKGGDVALLADFLLKEIAFKLWRYPKYGA